MPNDYALSHLDIAVLLGFLAAVVAITVRSARRAATTEAYFLAGRAAPGWVIGISFIGTSISSLSFLAFPAAAYQGNWAGLVPFLVIPFVAFLADRVCLPIYRRIGVASGYEYLERRFGAWVRLYGSAMFLLLQIGRMGLILVLLSLPMTLLTALSQENAIVVCGVFTTLYVLFGGLGAVLWTDVLQTVLLAFGAVFCIGLMCYELPEGLFSVFEIGGQAGKFAFPPWHVQDQSPLADFVQLTMVVLLLHGIFNQMLYYSADQNVIQRYLAAPSHREARKGLWIGSLGVVPMFVCFTFVGTCLYVYYTVQPDPRVATLSADAVFPHFILTQLPSGTVGLIVAALAAAAMSSLDSNLNALAMIFQIDIYRRYLVKRQPDKHYLRVAKLTTLIGGAVITLGALSLASVPVATLLDLMFLVYAIFAGGLAGLFLLGMLSRRASNAGVLVGITFSLAVSLYLTCSHFGWLLPESLRCPIHPYLIGAIGNSTLLITGYSASWLLLGRDAARNTEGLTVWSPSMDGPSPGATADGNDRME